MNKVKYSHYERMAGWFVVACVVVFGVMLIGVSIKQGWFESRVHFNTYVEEGDGIHPGTLVQIAGLKAGSVDDVELTQDNRILIKFHVLSRFADKVRADSHTQLIRPFVLGERVVEVTVGDIGSERMLAGSQIPSKETLDLMTVMSGRKVGDYLTTLSEMLANVKKLAEAFLGGDRTDAIIDMFDRIDPLLKNLNAMSVEVTKLSKQANRDERFGEMLSQLATTTRELNTFLPQIRKTAPEMGQNLADLVKNLADVSNQFKVLLPAFAEIAPELPRASKRALEALDESVVLIKAMQRSMLVRGSVKDVREEEARREPAGASGSGAGSSGAGSGGVGTEQEKAPGSEK